MSIFGVNLRRAMGDAGLRQEALAQLVGVSQGTVSTWVNGLSLPGSDELMRVSRALGVTMDWLMSGAVESGGKSVGCVRCAELQAELYALRMAISGLSKPGAVPLTVVQALAQELEVMSVEDETASRSLTRPFPAKRGKRAQA